MPCHRLAALLVLTTGLGAAMNADAGTRIERKPFGKNAGVELFTLTREGAPTVRITNQGGHIVSILAPDRTGAVADVTLGYAEFAGYAKSSGFIGATVGRYANRIAKGAFTLDGKKYTLAINNAPNTLHGGPTGFDTRLWSAQVVSGPDGDALELRYVSKDGEEGYPGTLSAKVVFSLRADGGLVMDYSATTDAPTVVNLTNHTYFNLEGEDAPTAEGHLLKINADFYTPTNSTQIPTHASPVDGTPFDWRAPTRIGDQIRIPHEQIMAGLGVDHNFVVRGEGLREHATLSATGSGITLTVVCDQPAVQCYTGNYLNGKLIGTSGRTYRQSSGIALETQHYPDSPNHPEFPSTLLRPDAEFTSRTVYRFSAR